LGGLIGPSKFDDNNGQKFATLTDFQQSDKIKRQENGNGAPYEQGLHFETSIDQDNTAKTTMEKSGKAYYGILSNNCAEAVQDAVKSVGLDDGSINNDNRTLPITPNEIFDNMTTNNGNKANVIPLAPIKQDNSRQNAKPCEIEP
jgi:hypothetical protein